MADNQSIDLLVISVEIKLQNRNKIILIIENKLKLILKNLKIN